jgi:hypothetical protein
MPIDQGSEIDTRMLPPALAENLLPTHLRLLLLSAVPTSSLLRVHRFVAALIAR